MRIAFVNNMPDAAFLDTERQFRAALVAERVDLRLYATPEIPRTKPVAALIARRYRRLDELLSGAVPPDALIVTGTEPTSASLADEPCWPAMTALLEWASVAVAHAMLSCLAGHAAILLFDGVPRERRATKLSGVYANEALLAAHPLVRGLRPSAPMPHSRVNDVAESELALHGYEVILRSQEAGWSVAARRHRRCSFVLCQGHPEYSALSLLREYRRDIRRSLQSGGEIPYPPVPSGYMEADGERLAHEFEVAAQARLRAAAEPSTLHERFPFAALSGTVRHSWAPTSTTLYDNWLGLIRAEGR